MAIKHSKKLGIYHWDTFDNETLLVAEADSLIEAIDIVRNKYGERISSSGADRVEIVDLKGRVVSSFSVT